MCESGGGEGRFGSRLLGREENRTNVLSKSTSERSEISVPVDIGGGEKSTSTSKVDDEALIES